MFRLFHFLFLFAYYVAPVLAVILAAWVALRFLVWLRGRISSSGEERRSRGGRIPAIVLVALVACALLAHWTRPIFFSAPEYLAINESWSRQGKATRLGSGGRCFYFRYVVEQPPDAVVAWVRAEMEGRRLPPLVRTSEELIHEVCSHPPDADKDECRDPTRLDEHRRQRLLSAPLWGFRWMIGGDWRAPDTPFTLVCHFRQDGATHHSICYLIVAHEGGTSAVEVLDLHVID